MTKKVVIIVSVLTVLLLSGTYFTIKTAKPPAAEAAIAYTEPKEEPKEQTTSPETNTPEETETIITEQADPKVEKIREITGLDDESSRMVVMYSEKLDMDVSLLLAVMKVESNFHQYAVGKSQDRGYFQIIPASEKAIAQHYAQNLGLSYDPGKIFEPEYNIGLASSYLKHLQTKYKGNLHRVLSEYNKGPGKLLAYFEENGTYVTEYSTKVLNAQEKYKKSLSY